MIRRLNFFTFLLSIYFVGAISAQDYPQEFWTSGTVKLKITKDIRFDLEQQVRFGNANTAVNEYFTATGIKFDLTKKISIDGIYRNGIDVQDFRYQRFQADFNYDWSKKKSPLSIGYRSRFQQSIQNNTSEQTTYWRHQLSMDYNLSKIVDPYITFECFFRFNQQNKFIANWYTAGLDWKLNDFFDVNTFFRIIDGYNKKTSSLLLIYGLGITYNLDLY
ncbi:MAG: DUF2490 domain-containing protein [Bacteroidales bacterium]|nr:DUF2490 domain-containing protein [Bacteroidales bacterium]